MKTGRKISIAVLLVLVLLLGFLLGRWQGGAAEHGDGVGVGDVEREVLFWTCAMHPEIHDPGPGRCRKCGMELIEVFSDEGGDELGERELSLSAGARKLAMVEVAAVERKFVTAEIRMVGKVVYDETRLGNITAWVPGRIDRLFADYTGIPVRKGDHMVELYSPELLTTQQELIEALRAVGETSDSGLASIRESAEATVEAVRERLRLWGLTAEQVSEIERRGTASDHVTIFSPVSGIVIEKHVREQAYVKTGARIYTVADLSWVWVKLDAYESDISWIRYGQAVEFSSESYPGESFVGKVAFIDPVLDSRTRTVKVRVNVENPYGKLKPGMFVRGMVRAKLTAGGKVVGEDLAGKWISPMHPEIVKDEPGNCDVCGMPLVRAETLGYASAGVGEAEAPLVIPASAALTTGKRAVVYVAVADEEGVYEGREIVLGPRAGEYYIVKEGLVEGEQVVAQGNFKIDSAMQILAKPSMMSPAGGVAAPVHRHGGGASEGGGADGVEGRGGVFEVPERFGEQLGVVFGGYFEIQGGLSGDDYEKARNGVGGLLEGLDGVDMGLLTGDGHKVWMKEQAGLKKIAVSMRDGSDIEAVRGGFALLSESMSVLSGRFGTGMAGPVYRMHCPMAFGGRGADWLSRSSEVENPYFGSAMFRCGSVVEIIGVGGGTH